VMSSPRVDLKTYEVGGGCTRCPLPKLMLNSRAQRLALPTARAGFGGKNHQTPNPSLGTESRKCGVPPHLSCACGVRRPYERKIID
jgi:hypothetical protein